jgi:hypothetical protein
VVSPSHHRDDDSHRALGRHTLLYNCLERRIGDERLRGRSTRGKQKDEREKFLHGFSKT